MYISEGDMKNITYDRIKSFFKSKWKFSYFIIRFLLNSSIVKSDNEIEKVNDKKNMI